MLYSEIIAVCSEIHTKHINTLCGQNVGLVNIKLVVHIVTTGLENEDKVCTISFTLKRAHFVLCWDCQVCSRFHALGSLQSSRALPSQYRSTVSRVSYPNKMEHVEAIKIPQFSMNFGPMKSSCKEREAALVCCCCRTHFILLILSIYETVVILTVHWRAASSSGCCRIPSSRTVPH